MRVIVSIMYACVALFGKNCTGIRHQDQRKLTPFQPAIKIA